MGKFKRLFEALERIYGKGFISKLFGKQSNVITLPSKDAKRFLTKELNMAEASEGAINFGKQDLEKIVSDTKRLSQLNDQELLIITNNAERLAQRVSPKAAPTAEVIDLGTREKVSPEGVMSLTEKIGQKNAPGTLMGNIESRIKKLETSGQDLSKMKGQSLDEVVGDFADGQQGMAQAQKEGLVKATASDIMIADMKSGKFPATKEMQQEILEGSPKTLDYFRQFYGEDALEVLDSLKPDFSKIKSSREAADFAKKQFNFDPKMDRPPGSTNVDDAIKVEKEFGIGTLKDDIEDPEGFAGGGRVGMASGGVTALKSLIRFLGKDSGKKGSQMLKEINPKQFGYRFDMLDPEIKKEINKNRLEYLENLSNVVKADKRLLKGIEDLPEKWKDLTYKQFNEGGNKGRLDVYNKIDIDDAIGDIEQMKKNLEFKDIPGKEIQRKMNADGGSQGLDYLMGIERRGYAEGSMDILPDSANNPFYSGWEPSNTSTTSTPNTVDQLNNAILYSNFVNQIDARSNDTNATTNSTSNTMNAPFTSSYSMTPMDALLGMISPVTGIATMAAKNYGYPSLGYALGAMTGLGPGGAGGGYGASNTSGAVDTGDLGSEAANDAATAAAAASVGAASSGSEGSEGGTDSAGDGGDGYAMGGRVNYAYGSGKLLKLLKKGKKTLQKKSTDNMTIDLSDAMDDSRIMKEMGLQGGKSGDYDKFLEMKLSGELGPQKQMKTIKMELFNKYSNFLDEATMDLVQSSDDPQKVAEVYANVREASILKDRGLGTEEIVNTIVNTPRTKQAYGTKPQGLNYLMGY